MRIIFYITFPVGFVFALHGYILGMPSYFATNNLGTGIVAWGLMSVVILTMMILLAFGSFVISKLSGDTETLQEYIREITCVKDPERVDGFIGIFVAVPLLVGLHSFLVSFIGFRYEYITSPGIRTATAAFGMSIGFDFMLISFKAILKRFSTKWYEAPLGLEHPSSFN